MQIKRINRQRVGLLALFLLSRYWLVYTTNTFFETAFVDVHLFTRFEFYELAKLFCSVLNVGDYLAIGVFVLTCLILILLELKSCFLSDLLEELCKSNRGCLLIVLYFSLLNVAPFFSPGLPYRGDGVFHLFSSWSVLQNFKEGSLNLSTNFFWCGYAFAKLYGPLFSVLTGALGWILGDFEISFKVLLGCMYVLSGVGMYGYMTCRTGRPLAGIIAALVYELIYFRYHWILNMGRLRYELYLCAFPFLWWVVDSYLLVKKNNYVLIFSLLISALVLTQPGPYAIYTLIFLFVYTVLILFFERTKQENANSFIRLWLFSGVLVALMTGWLLLPDVFIKQEASSALFFRRKFDLPPATFADLLMWTPIPKYSHYGAYWGWSVCLLTGLGILWALIVKNFRGVVFTTLFFLNIYLVFGHLLPGYSLIPFVHTFHSSGYFLLFAVFLSAVLSGYGAAYILATSKCRSSRLMLIVISFLLVDLMSLRFQDSFGDKPTNDRLAAYEWLHDYESKKYRVADNADELAFHAGQMTIQTGFQAVNGVPLRFEKIRTKPIIHSMMYDLQRVSEGKPTVYSINQLKDLLFLTNTGYVLSRGSLPSHLYKEEISFQDGIHLYRLNEPSPVLAASSINFSNVDLEGASSATMQTLMNGFVINYSTRTARISLSPSCQTYIPETYSTNVPKWNLGYFKIGASTSRFLINTNAPSIFQLSLAYHPELKIKLDGVVVKDACSSAFGFIVLPVPKGEHIISVEPATYPIRRVLLITAGGTFIFSAIGALWSFRRNSRSSLNSV